MSYKVDESIYKQDPRYGYIEDETEFKRELIQKLQKMPSNETLTILLNGKEKRIRKNDDQSFTIEK